MADYDKKVIRAPSLKRGKTEEKMSNRIRLEKVLGVTVASNAALSSDKNGIVAYPAGCTVVLFNTATEHQSHIVNTSKKTITSLAYSACGRYLVTGECGHQPAVRVWDLQSEPQSQHPGLPPQPQPIAEFLGHKYGVNCVAFSPTNKYVVSVGTQHDMIVNVWDWRNNTKIASNKVSTKVKAIDFAENGAYFVTVGNRHVKFWYLEQGKAKYKEAVPLMGRSAILGEQRNNYFCDVACGRGDSGDSTYAITRSGLLCEFNNRRLLDKWVELRTSSANCIALGVQFIFVGCADGIVRCFDMDLRFVTTLPRCHYLGVDVALGTNITHMASPPADAKYPDTVAITYDEINNKLTSIYNDHSVYVWDVLNIKRVGKSFSALYHSACIWGVEMAPAESPLPHGTFLTCGSDDTIRLWSLDQPSKHDKHPNYPSNIYSKELLKVLYIDKSLTYLKDLDISATQTSAEKQETSYDSRNGVRCIRISPDGQQIASGDRSGNIRLYDTVNMRESFKIEAHDAEVLCLEYSSQHPDYHFLASASRDRLIHIFDVKNNHKFVQTLDDHSSSITAVKFLKSQRQLQMVSCGADKSLIFRTLNDSNKNVQFVREHNATGKTTLYDMEVDAGQKHVLTACQDRNVRIYSVNNGKHTRSFKGSAGDEGTLIKVTLDRSGIYLATSCTDKSLSVFDYYSGECMATMCGHSELATGLKFTNDCRRLISASGDGCIFVWKVPHDLIVTMHARLSQQNMRHGTKTFEDAFQPQNDDLLDQPNYRFSIGGLPQWAKKQLGDEPTIPMTRGVAAPKGRWAQRAETNKNYSISPFASLGSDGSKDSSLDSGGNAGNLRQGNDLDLPNDADIDSDQEYRHRPLYYPTHIDSASGSEFTVTNMDQDELRKSQRKRKPPKLVLPVPSSAPNYASNSNDSDDDDDDASTPSGDNTDKNPMSMLSISSESLDHLVSREKYLQSTFESMSGAESERLHSSNNTSFSSKFLRTGDRNQEAIHAVQLQKMDPEVMRKREELNKRIAETKRKLESVGHQSPLKSSQSIHDLSHIPVRDSWNSPTASSSSSSAKKQVNVEDPNLRRSCSLVDLSMSGMPATRKLDNVSGKKSVSISRSTSRYQKNNTAISRSRSTTILNASDSEDNGKMSRLMRPTISSHNKTTAPNKPLSTSRKKQSYSTSNLTAVGMENMSTSDDEVEKSPSAPPRNRGSLYGIPKKHNNSSYHDKTLTSDDFNASLDSSIEISDQLCDDTIQELIKAAENVVKLYNNIGSGQQEQDSSQRHMDRVKMSIIRTHKILHDFILADLKQSNSSLDLNQTDTVKKLSDLVSRGPSSSTSIVDIMEQYSEILLEMVQQKIHNANI